VCVIIIKIALKQVYMAFGKALPNHCFVGKTMAVHYHVFYNLRLALEYNVGLVKCVLL